MADKAALARATESTDSPTPGYLYNDIAKTVSASPVACTETVNYLVRRLTSKNNHNIKFKCLKVMQMVSQSSLSRGQFKRSLCQNTAAMSAIKDCLNFRGPPDAVHGDQIYVKVRQQAKDTLDAVYSDDPSSSQQSNNSMSMGSYSSAAGGMSGYGSGGYGGGGGGMSGGYGNSAGAGAPPPPGPRKMEGIGNPMFKDPRLEQSDQKDIQDMTVGEVFSAAKEGFKGIIKDPLARNMEAGRPGTAPGGMPGYGSSSGSWNSAPPGQAQLAHSTGGAWTMASNRGPNAISHDPTRDAYQNQRTTSGTSHLSGGVGGSWASAPSQPSIASQSRATAHATSTPYGRGGNVVSISGSTGVAASDGSYERNLIQELCPPGGMKAEPPTEKLEAFKQAVPSLNADLVCPALLDALEDGQPWIIRAKALCVMETSILVAEKQSKASGGNNAYADFFHACSEEIQPLANHSRAAVREPAKRVLRALGMDVPNSVPARAQTAPVAPKVVAPPPNLLDFDDASAPAVPPPPVPADAPPAPPAANTMSNGDSLFGGMNVKDTSQAPPPAPEPEKQDLLGVVEDVPSSSSLPATENKPESTPQSTGSSDLFGGMNVNNAPEKSSTVGKENIVNESKSEDASGSTSGFSFMNSGDKADNAEKPTSTPSKETFDPLLSLGSNPSGAQQQNPMQQQQQQQMQMNPQMAAAYQQQIMMMQMQMQQMQMANGSAGRMMMMQQNSPGVPKASQGTSGMVAPPVRQTPVMGATGGSGVATSFAFMEDPAKAKREASNKKFDFVQDAMKGAK